jgi:flagellar biosynthesis component FlhA
LVDDLATRRLLDLYETELYELVSATVPPLLTVTQLSQLFRSLVEEGLGLRNIDVILQAVAEGVPRVGVGRPLLEEVRIALRRVISASVAPTGTLRCHPTDGSIDMALVRAEREGIPVPTELFGFLDQFLQSLEDVPVVVVASRGARLLLRELIQLRRTNVTVIAYEELVDVTLETATVLRGSDEFLMKLAA